MDAEGSGKRDGRGGESQRGRRGSRRIREESGLLNGTEGCGLRQAEFAVVRMSSTSIYYKSSEARHIHFYYFTMLQQRQPHLS